MASKFKKILNLLYLFVPKYTRIIASKIKLKLYSVFGNNKKTFYDKFNIRFCRLFYRFFKTSSGFNIEMKTPNKIESKVIFVFWYTGIDTMPSIIKMCYDNLIKTTKYKVILSLLLS